MEKRKENIEICGNFINSACGIFPFFEVYLRHICFIFLIFELLCAELLVTSVHVRLIRF